MFIDKFNNCSLFLLFNNFSRNRKLDQKLNFN